MLPRHHGVRPSAHPYTDARTTDKAIAADDGDQSNPWADVSRTPARDALPRHRRHTLDALSPAAGNHGLAENVAASRAVDTVPPCPARVVLANSAPSPCETVRWRRTVRAGRPQRRCHGPSPASGRGRCGSRGSARADRRRVRSAAGHALRPLAAPLPEDGVAHAVSGGAVQIAERPGLAGRRDLGLHTVDAAGVAAAPTGRWRCRGGPRARGCVRSEGAVLTLPGAGTPSSTARPATSTARRAGCPTRSVRVPYRSRLRWINHTYTHAFLGCEQDTTVVPWPMLPLQPESAAICSVRLTVRL